MIVFTDLDGTLLDHGTYSHAPADATLSRLAAKGIPVVLASSKTGAEIAPLRAEIGMTDVPAIVENGAGILQPGADGSGDDSAYRRIRAALDTLPVDLRSAYQGFGDWGADGIATKTGLSNAAAALAAQRQFSEPGLWSGTDDARMVFLEHLKSQGITAQQGGRFLTLSHGATKADRMDQILTQFGNPFSIALGDAPNDLAMLHHADLGIIVQNPASPALPHQPGEDSGQIIRTNAPGPAGWAQAMTAQLDTRIT
ncbi:mannosyl-3-phosphoglycerate phosphatase [Actibacterium mucosum KCTC 23349]|uniref:Mannosyl-3-phosphoglycerate phosphatase n=1 Tax=Actibacterium mucosum KCTC 23349 TaxID=1454373 RepID=A0A037ZL32_9RHOB|nr:mannosyl-3-phosphoglycerate phosphatase [Actibacterium mucosum KCTC 23349]